MMMPTSGDGVVMTIYVTSRLPRAVDRKQARERLDDFMRTRSDRRRPRQRRDRSLREAASAPARERDRGALCPGRTDGGAILGPRSTAVDPRMPQTDCAL